MNFRECRQNSIHRILKILDNDLTPQKNFMLLGGIRSGMYILNYHGVNMVILSGCAEINCPGIFDILGIEYSCIDPGSFIKHFQEGDNRNSNIYIIPILREMLNTDTIDLQKLYVVGQSFLTVKSIDDKNIYFEVPNGSDEYYLDIRVFNTLKDDNRWVIESEFCVYEINIDKVCSNLKLKEFVKKSDKELLYENVDNFLQNNKITGDYGTLRIDGEQVYDIIENHLMSMKKNLEKVKNTDSYDKFIKYIYIQLVNIRKHIAAGSDGYYRTEFCEVLSNYSLPGIEHNLNEWKNIIYSWRLIGRRLAQVANMKYLEHNAEEALDSLSETWKVIKNQEIYAIHELENMLVH